MRVDIAEVAKHLLPRGPAPTAEEQTLLALFLELWPDQRRNVASFRAKPDCSCRGELYKAMSDDVEKLKRFVTAIGPIVPTVTTAAVQVAVPAAPTMPRRHIGGQVRDIPNDQDQYTALLTSLRTDGLSFTGLAVRSLPNNILRVYFY